MQLPSLERRRDATRQVLVLGLMLVLAALAWLATLALPGAPFGTAMSHDHGGVLLLAGAYQFSPLKAGCLRQCRSSLAFLMRAWRDGWDGA